MQARRVSIKHVPSLVLFMLALTLLLVGCGLRGGGQGSGGDGGEGEQTYTIRFSHENAAGTPGALSAEKFKEILEQKTDGQITVETYANSELFSDQDELQAIQSGAVEVLSPPASKLSSSIAPRIQVLDLPFIFDSPEEVQEATAPDTPLGKALHENENLAERNIKWLNTWHVGFFQISSNREVRAPEDMQGLKMRILPSDVMRSVNERWGAEPTTMAYTEVFTGLQQGVIEGQENPYTNIWSQKFHTVQDYITEANFAFASYGLIIRKDYFNSLPEDLQQAVIDAAEEATAYNVKAVTETNLEDKQKIQEAGTTEIIELSDQERQAFKDAVVPEVWNESSSVVGEDVISYLKSRQNTEEIRQSETGE